LGSPQSGFKPWRLSINPTLPESATGVKHQVYIPPAPSQFDSAFVAPWPSCHSSGFLRPPSLGPALRPPWPTGPWLRVGSVVPPLCATPTRSASLTDSRCFPRSTGYTAGLCPTTWSGLPASPSLLWVTTPSVRAVTPTPRGGAGYPSLPRSPWPSSTAHGGGSSPVPHTSFSEGFATDAAVFASCYGPQSCWPSWTSPTERLTPVAEDVYTRACPRPVTRTPSRVSRHRPPGGRL
jgi:hypothetical protein